MGLVRGGTRRWVLGLVVAAATWLLGAQAADEKAAKKPEPSPSPHPAHEQKVATLEDFYGDSGKRFQAALSFYNREPISSTIAPNVNGYGFAVDDMFISWKETRLDEDTTVCAGECADLEVNSTLAYEPAGFV